MRKRRPLPEFQIPALQQGGTRAPRSQAGRNILVLKTTCFSPASFSEEFWLGL